MANTALKWDKCYEKKKKEILAYMLDDENVRDCCIQIVSIWYIVSISLKENFCKKLMVYEHEK